MKEIEAEEKKDKGDDAMAIYKHQSEYFRSMDKNEEHKNTTTDEESKSTVVKKTSSEGGEISIDDLVTQAVSTQPWLEELPKEKSDIGMMIKGANGSFNKRHMPIIMLANLMKITDTKIENILQFPYINNE